MSVVLPLMVTLWWDLLQLKKVLSSIPETMLNVESLMNDLDVSSKMTREIFETKSASILERVKLPLQTVSHRDLPSRGVTAGAFWRPRV